MTNTLGISLRTLVSAAALVIAVLLVFTHGGAVAGDGAHPLLGTRWSISAGAETRAPGTRSIRIEGEVHDNGGHHRLRAAAIERSTGAAVFEQLRTDQQPAIDAFLALPKAQRTVDAFFKAVDWEKSGWSKYDYRPLFQAVLSAELPIYAGDPTKELIRKAAKEGAAALPGDDLKRLGLDAPLDPSLHDASLTEIEASHCGMMPKAAFGGMAFAQRLRDATLADVSLAALERHGAVTVFAGNGHVRTDRGVPWYLHRRAPGVAVTATMYVEVEDGSDAAGAYVPRDPGGRPAADALVFTPRAARDDPCAAFRKAAPSAGPAGGAVTKN